VTRRQKFCLTVKDTLSVLVYSITN